MSSEFILLPLKTNNLSSISGTKRRNKRRSQPKIWEVVDKCIQNLKNTPSGKSGLKRKTTGKEKDPGVPNTVLTIPKRHRRYNYTQKEIDRNI